MIAQFLILVFFPALLITAAGWDLATYTIPNFIPAAMALLFLVLAMTAGLSAAAWGIHALAGAVALVIGFGLFAAGFIGGGDAKLFAAVALLLGANDGLSYALMSAIYGGGLTLAILLLRRFPLPGYLARPWIVRLHDEKAGIPYGVALAAGAFMLLPHSEIFRAASLG